MHGQQNIKYAQSLHINIPVSVFIITVRQKYMSAAMWKEIYQYICYKQKVRKYKIHVEYITSSSKIA
jgi:hypothetical protein